MDFLPHNIRIDSLKKEYQPYDVDVLRLDEVHPQVSGNKWFKLREYLRMYTEQGKAALLTFGGAWSNHILATAAACHEMNIPCIGIIRGERPPVLSQTLADALALGMELHFIARDAYRLKEIPVTVSDRWPVSHLLVVPEGGYGPEGCTGAASILDHCKKNNYSHIMAAAGTGTTIAGLVTASGVTTQIIGIPVIRHDGLRNDINQLLPTHSHDRFLLLTGYHFGGYAKTSTDLFHFMNSFYERTGIPTDMVYTGKLFFALEDLARENYFPAASKILVIHSGGLQGNRSLPAGTLMFHE